MTGRRAARAWREDELTLVAAVRRVLAQGNWLAMDKIITGAGMDDFAAADIVDVVEQLAANGEAQINRHGTLVLVTNGDHWSNW